MNYAQFLAHVKASRWALVPEQYAALVAALEHHHAISPQAIVGERERESRRGSVAVVSLHGVILDRHDVFADFFGLASHEGFAATLRAVADDDSISQIVLDIDSGGGMVSGVDTSVEAMRYAVSKKPVTVAVTGMCASAAYWIAAQAPRIVVSPTSIVGSISVIMEHVDVSARLEQDGVKVTVLTTGKWKALGHQTKPLDDEGEEKLLSEMMDVHDIFVGDVAQGRRVNASDAQSRWADGSVWIGQKALEVGLTDELGTLQSVLDTITKPRASQRRKGTGAKMDLEQLKAEHPELYEQIVAQGRAEGKTQAETEATLKAAGNGNGKDLEDEVVRLRATTERLEQERLEEKRKNIASTKLEAAALPKAGVTPSGLDLDASFRAHVEDLALNAKDDEEARTKVDAAIAERRALMGEKKGEKKERRAFLPTGDTEGDTEQPAVQATLNSTRRSMGLR